VVEDDPASSADELELSEDEVKPAWSPEGSPGRFDEDDEDSEDEDSDSEELSEEDEETSVVEEDEPCEDGETSEVAELDSEDELSLEDDSELELDSEEDETIGTTLFVIALTVGVGATYAGSTLSSFLITGS